MSDVRDVVSEVFRYWRLAPETTEEIQRVVAELAAVNGEATTREGLFRAASAVQAAMRLARLPDRGEGR